MAEPKDSFLRDMVREVLGEWIGFRYFQRGSVAQPGTTATAARRGSLLAAIYKANLTPAKRQQALDFNTYLEQKNPSGKSRLEEAVDNDGLAKMLETGTPAEWMQSVPRSGIQHLQTTFFGDDESRARRKPPWWGTALRWLCIGLIVVIALWIAFPQLHN
jgi:hypothetical protein